MKTIAVMHMLLVQDMDRALIFIKKHLVLPLVKRVIFGLTWNPAMEQLPYAVLGIKQKLKKLF
jgi:hypothetical protein